MLYKTIIKNSCFVVKTEPYSKENRLYVCLYIYGEENSINIIDDISVNNKCLLCNTSLGLITFKKLSII